MSAIFEGSAGDLIPMLVALIAYGAVALAIGLRAQRARPVTGPEGLIGLRAVALSRIAPEQAGQVFVRGEIWEALPLAGERPIAPEEIVAVVRLDGLTARVSPAGAP